MIHEVHAGLTLERVVALEQQVLELRRRTAPVVGGHDRRRPSPLDCLSPREREVLELMAQGCSNTGVALRLHLSERTVEATTAHLFRKLGLEPSRLTNRRVQAVLVLLGCRGGRIPAPAPAPESTQPPGPAPDEPG